jgi:putative surface-exposed virulence protein
MKRTGWNNLPTKAFCLLCLFQLPMYLSLCHGKVITVPGDHATIQAAIDASTDGDEIIVSPSTYAENINFGGKNIILRSTEPTNLSLVASTIIDGSSSDSVVIFSGTELTTCVLSGFTLRNGYADYGGGVLGNGTLATLQNNIILGNVANRGGGVFGCDGLIQNNNIEGNTAMDYGGGLCMCNGIIQNNIVSNNAVSGSVGVMHDFGGGGLCDCNGTIQNNSIFSNSVTGYVSLGGGLFSCTGTIQNNIISGNSAIGTYSTGGALSHCHGIIQNNIICGNLAAAGGGLCLCDGTIQNNTICMNSANSRGGGLYNSNGIIRNCILWQNAAPVNAQLDTCSTPSYSCIQDWNGGGVGNISLDPRLVDPATDNFHLQPTSPCIDAGCYIAGLTQDFDGDARPYDGTSEPRGDGSDFDIGADECMESLTAVRPTIWPLY